MNEILIKMLAVLTTLIAAVGTVTVSVTNERPRNANAARTSVLVVRANAICSADWWDSEIIQCFTVTCCSLTPFNTLHYTQRSTENQTSDVINTVTTTLKTLRQ